MLVTQMFTSLHEAINARADNKCTVKAMKIQQET